MNYRFFRFFPVLLMTFILFSCSREEPTLVSSTPPPEPTIIKMNEIYSRGVVTDPDWIEIYNESSVAVNIGGYKIYDIGGQAGTKPKMVIPAGMVVPAKGFFVVVTDIPTTTDPSGFGLSSAGEEVWLEDATGKLIDNVVFPAMETTQTYARVPDGGAWKLTNTITRGTSNR